MIKDAVWCLCDRQDKTEQPADREVCRFFLCAGCPRPMKDNMEEWLPVTVSWILVSGSLHRLFDPEPGFTPVFPLVAQAYQSKH